MNTDTVFIGRTLFISNAQPPSFTCLTDVNEFGSRWNTSEKMCASFNILHSVSTPYLQLGRYCRVLLYSHLHTRPYPLALGDWGELGEPLWINYRMGLKHNINNRISAELQSHSVVLFSRSLTNPEADYVKISPNVLIFKCVNNSQNCIITFTHIYIRVRASCLLMDGYHAVYLVSDERSDPSA